MVILAITRAILILLTVFLSTLGGMLAPGGFRFAYAVATDSATKNEHDPSFEEDEGVLQATKKANANESPSYEYEYEYEHSAKAKGNCFPSSFEPSVLEQPCELDRSEAAAPEAFSLVFPTQYGTFTAECVRQRAPVWADRVYKLAKHGYYNDNYFFRVIPGRYVQFGTNGNPAVSNVYNYTSASTSEMECSVLRPQPPDMPYCLLSSSSSSSSSPHNCEGVPALSNLFGTLSMSTSYQEGIPGYPGGVTWNATAELFLNIGDNPSLDSNLFVPICTIDKHEMESVVLKFPSFGEVAELGGSGPSLGLLYQDGNSYIESDPEWKASMAVSGTVSVCNANANATAVGSENDGGGNENKNENKNKNDDPPAVEHDGNSGHRRNNEASAGTIGRNPSHPRRLSKMLPSLVWKGIAVWLISWIVLN